MRCTTMPRTSELPFGSGRPRPYLYHQRAEQSMKVRTWEGDSTSATWLTGAAGCDACDGCWVMGDGAGTSSSSGGASNSENWLARALVDHGIDALLGRQQAIGRDGIQRAATEAVEEFLHRQGLRRRHRGPPLELPFVFETLMNADSNSERTSSDLMSPSWRAE